MPHPRPALSRGFLFVLPALLPAVASAASIDFHAPRHFPAGDGPAWVEAADLDRDGDLDLTVASFGGITPAVLILSADGRGHFAPPRSVALNPNMSPNVVRAADLDRDGDLDLVVADRTGRDIDVVLGDGAGGFGPFHSYPSGGSRDSLDLADFDGDGILDLVGATGFGGAVAFLRGDGAGGFAPPRSYAVGSNTRQVVAADLDGDRRPDVAVTDSDAGVVAILINDGSGSFLPARLLPAVTASAALAAADVTGDGRPDLIVGSTAGKALLILRNDGAGIFPSLPPVDAGASVAAIRGADLDADGHLDLIVVHGYDADAPINVSTLRGRGDGTFDPARRFETGSNPVQLAVADFDGDRRPDVVTANQRGDDVTLLAGDGAGGLLNEPRLPLAELPFAIASADFNHDGRADLAVANFEPPTITTGLQATASPSRAAGAAGIGPSPAASPFDCFDFPMLVSIFLGASSGPPVPAGSYPVRCSPESLVVADFNGDGHPDIATGNVGINDLYVYVPPSVTVLLGDGHGAFPIAVDSAVTGSPASIAAVRANTDGLPDLAVATDAGTNLDLYLGDGGGSFAFWRNAFVGTQARSLKVGDLNEDGINDLVMALPEQDWIGISPGQPLGGFGAGSRLTALDRPTEVALADFNDDHHLDIVAAYHPFTGPNSELTVHDSVGAGAFDGPIVVQAGASPAGPLGGDFDLDGHGDLATLLDGQTVGVFPGDGSGRFAAAQRFETGGGPNVSAVGDFDGDGLSDLAVASQYPPAVSILRNITGADYRGGVIVEPGVVSWPEAPGAVGYDLVEGDLRRLLETKGDFSTAVTGCLANDVPFTSLTGARDPGPGQGYFYVERPVFPSGPGTYDDGTAGQVGSRDAEIEASAAACP